MCPAEIPYGRCHWLNGLRKWALDAWSAMHSPCQAHQLQGQGGYWQLQISSHKHKTIQPERYPPCQPPRDLMRPCRRPPGKVARSKTGRRDCTRPGRAPTVRHGHKGPSWCQRIPWVKGRENSPADAKAYRRHKAGLRIKTPWLPRARMVWLHQPKRGLRTRPLKGTLLREPGKRRKPRLLLPLRTVGPR